MTLTRVEILKADLDLCRIEGVRVSMVRRITDPAPGREQWGYVSPTWGTYAELEVTMMSGKVYQVHWADEGNMEGIGALAAAEQQRTILLNQMGRHKRSNPQANQENS